MHHSQLIDWRVWKAFLVASSAPPADAKAPAMKKGDIGYVISSIDTDATGLVNFITPSPVAMALNVAIRAAREATALLQTVDWKVEPVGGAGKWADKENLPLLYAYFERSMIAVTFAFQSLESYANQVIVQSLKGTMKLKRQKKEVEWNATEIERNCSTEEKFAVVLPVLGNAKSPRGTKTWENFVKLKDVRDATIHLKDVNQYVRGTADEQTLYYEFLSHDPTAYPLWAIAMMRHFTPPGTDSWLLPAEELLTS